jgi:hypothetical protein
LEQAVLAAKAQGQKALLPGETLKEGHTVTARCGSKAFRNPVSDRVEDETRPHLDIAPGPPFDNTRSHRCDGNDYERGSAHRERSVQC